jgi:hypothetical protein
VGDFSHVHEEAFVDAAYRAVLSRAPDSTGKEHFLGLLREGASKAEILRRMRYSPEGEAIGTTIDGLPQPDIAPVPAPEKGRMSRLSDFAGLHDVAFLDAAYRAALGRTPDSIGKEFYLGLLRKGASQAEVLGRLRYSPEGRGNSASIDGLARAYRFDRLARWPILGRCFRFLAALWGLADSDRRLRIIASDLARPAAEAEQQSKLVEQVSKDALRDVAAKVSLLANQLAARTTREESALIQQAIAELRTLVGALDGSKASLAEVRRLHEEVAADKVDRRELAAFGRSLTAAVEARPSREQLEKLGEELKQLFVASAALRQSKVDASQLATMRTEVRTVIHRGIDDVNRTFRMLLESKVDQTALVEAQRNFEAAIESGVARVMQALHAIDAKKADAAGLETVREEIEGTLRGAIYKLEASVDGRITSAMQAVRSSDSLKLETENLQLIREELKAEALGGLVNLEATFESRFENVLQVLREVQTQRPATLSEQAIRDQYRDALRAGLEGLTNSIAALAAEKIDRATVDRLLAESSQTTLTRMVQTLNELRASAADSRSKTRPQAQRKK